MSHPGFGVGAGGPPQIAPEQPTQLEATVIGSSPPMDELLPTQPHPPIIQVQNAQVEDPGTEPVATLQTRYLVCLQKEIRGGIREAEIATQYDGLVKAIVVCQEGSETLPPKASKGRMEPPVEPKGSPDFSHIDLLFQGCSEEEYIGYIVDAAGEYEGPSEGSDDCESQHLSFQQQ